MFENEDWNFDEDDLLDLNIDDVEKNIENKGEDKTQIANTQDSENKERLSVNTSRFEFNCTGNENFIINANSQSQSSDTTSRKNVVLDIFKEVNANHSANISESHSSQLHVSFSNLDQPIATSTFNHQCKKDIVLNVFKEKEPVTKNNTLIPMPIVKSVLKVAEAAPEEDENNLKRKRNVAFFESANKTKCTKKMCISTIKESVNASKLGLNIQQDNQVPSTSRIDKRESYHNINDSRKQILKLLKSPVQGNLRVAQIKQAVVRKFPGPAGLLPDDTEDTEVININSLDENKNNKENKYSNICSQNTKNLFTTGAWQLMMDDLPANFELCDIATIKENALEYSRTYKKVPYLAGIIQYIDYKPNDPHMILKDLSGKIDARIHHSICKLYPNALGTNVVVLVKDVGLLVTSKKYVCIIISPKNLVSIYSDDARLVETSHLEKLLDTNYNLQESQISILDEIEFDENNFDAV